MMTTTTSPGAIELLMTLNIGAPLALMTTLALIALLIVHEAMVAARHPQAIRWRRTLRVGMVPLAISVAIIVAVRIAESL